MSIFISRRAGNYFNVLSMGKHVGVISLVVFSLALSQEKSSVNAAGTNGHAAEMAKFAFERFKKLEGKTITFTFFDATNLKSRDQGHMDKAVLRFLDNDHFTTQWTWYQNGTEKWREEIQMARQPR